MVSNTPPPLGLADLPVDLLLTIAAGTDTLAAAALSDVCTATRAALSTLPPATAAALPPPPPTSPAARFLRASARRVVRCHGGGRPRLPEQARGDARAALLLDAATAGAVAVVTIGAAAWTGAAAAPTVSDVKESGGGGGSSGGGVRPCRRAGACTVTLVQPCGGGVAAPSLSAPAAVLAAALAAAVTHGHPRCVAALLEAGAVPPAGGVLPAPHRIVHPAALPDAAPTSESPRRRRRRVAVAAAAGVVAAANHDGTSLALLRAAGVAGDAASVAVAAATALAAAPACARAMAGGGAESDSEADSCTDVDVDGAADTASATAATAAAGVGREAAVAAPSCTEDGAESDDGGPPAPPECRTMRVCALLGGCRYTAPAEVGALAAAVAAAPSGALPPGLLRAALAGVAAAACPSAVAVLVAAYVGGGGGGGGGNDDRSKGATTAASRAAFLAALRRRGATRALARRARRGGVRDGWLSITREACVAPPAGPVARGTGDWEGEVEEAGVAGKGGVPAAVVTLGELDRWWVAAEAAAAAVDELLWDAEAALREEDVGKEGGMLGDRGAGACAYIYGGVCR